MGTFSTETGCRDGMHIHTTLQHIAVRAEIFIRSTICKSLHRQKRKQNSRYNSTTALHARPLTFLTDDEDEFHRCYHAFPFLCRRYHLGAMGGTRVGRL